LRVFVDYLKSQLPLANIIIIGVQAGRRDLMQPFSPEVETTLNNLVDFLWHGRDIIPSLSSRIKFFVYATLTVGLPNFPFYRRES
jgi:hypothetical protein